MSALSGPVAGDGGETGTGARRDETERCRATEGDDTTGELREAIARYLHGLHNPDRFWHAEWADHTQDYAAADAVLALPALRDLLAERDTLAAQVQAVEGLHESWPTEGDEISYCASCEMVWPCDTRRALGTPTTGGGE